MGSCYRALTCLSLVPKLPLGVSGPIHAGGTVGQGSKCLQGGLGAFPPLSPEHFRISCPSTLFHLTGTLREDETWVHITSLLLLGSSRTECWPMRREGFKPPQVDGVSCRLHLPNSLGLTYVQHSKLDYAGLPILGLHLCLVSSLAARDTCEF